MATDLVRFFGALAILVALAAFARQAARWTRQPAVLGELLLGVVLGPTLLGWAWPGGHDFLLGGANAPLLDGLAWIGLVLFMLVAGAEMEWHPKNGLAAIGVASGGLVLPATAGAFLALFAPDWFFDRAPTGPGILLVATIMTVTALPVLARILADLQLLDRPTAAVTMAAATIDDVAGWIALALAAAAGHPGLTGSLGGNLALVFGLLAAVLVLDHLLAARLRPFLPQEPAHLFVAVVVATFAAALLTHEAGLHAVVGPLAVGAVVSRHRGLRDVVAERFRGVAFILLLPMFFILTVGQADLRLVVTDTGLLALLVVLIAATTGKVVGCYAGARMAGLTHDQGLGAGILMNARGAVGLVVAKVGLDAGLLAPHGFALMVLVIVLTTLLAAPALAWHVRRVGVGAL
ncbi:MAG: cation:proton antiporter [Candidatus Thermoplasmatota archaeon]